MITRTPSTLSSTIALAVALFACHAQASTTVTAQISDIEVTGDEFDYTITLQNTGTTSIETFWNAWIPGKDYMAVSPTDIVSPLNWSAVVTNGGGADGYAIQWTTANASTPAPLAPNASLTFSFESTVTPAAMAGDSVFYPTTPVETSFVYTGAPLSGSSEEFVVAPVPEPTSAALLVLAGLGYLCARRRRVLTRADSRSCQSENRAFATI